MLAETVSYRRSEALKPIVVNRTRKEISRTASLALAEGNPDAGIKMGAAYKGLAIRVLNDWFETNAPKTPEYQGIGLAIHGSIARNEGCYYSDVDLAVCTTAEKAAQMQPIVTSLKDYLSDAGFYPDVAVWYPGMEQAGDNLVLGEQISFAEHVVGDTDIIEEVRATNPYSPRLKAMKSIFESYKPPPFARVHEEGILHTKYDTVGGLDNIMVVRAIGNVYSDRRDTTGNAAETLLERGIYDQEDVDLLNNAYSDLLVYRSLMHSFANDKAERLGPHTKLYIAKMVPELGTLEEVSAAIDLRREQIFNLMRKAVSGFFTDMGMDPDLFDKLREADEPTRINLLVNNRLPDYIPWVTGDPEILDEMISGQPSYSTIVGVARSKSASPETFDKIVDLAGEIPNSLYIKRLLIGNQSVPLPVILRLFEQDDDPRVHRRARNRIARQLEWYDKVDPAIQKKAEVMCFYPAPLARTLLLEDAPVSSHEAITPGKLYLNFAGRLDEGANVISYLETIKGLHEKGIDFEAHIYGDISKEYLFNIHKFWETIEDPAFFDKVKYHGHFEPGELLTDVASMQEAGSPVFLFSKGILTHELGRRQVPIITTREGNYKVDGLPVDLCYDTDLEDLSVFTDSILDRIHAFTGKTEKSTTTEQSLGATQIITALTHTAGERRHVIVRGTHPQQFNHEDVLWTKSVVPEIKKAGYDVGIGFDRSTWDTLQRTSGEALVDMPELEGSQWMHDFNNFVSAIYTLSGKQDISDWFIKFTLQSLMRMSEDPESLAKLGSKQAEQRFKTVTAEAGFDPNEINFPLLMLDEISFFGEPNDPDIKLGRWMQMLRKTQRRDDSVTVTFNDTDALLAVAEKSLYEVPYILLDHEGANDISTSRFRKVRTHYLEAEKNWFEGLLRFVRISSLQNADAYVPSWAEEFPSLAGEENRNNILRSLTRVRERVPHDQEGEASIPIGAYFYPQTTTSKERLSRARAIQTTRGLAGPVTIPNETDLIQYAAPLFEGHDQPKIFALGRGETIWDDADENTMQRHIELAKKAGISFWIFDTYEGNSRGRHVREMSQPVEVFKNQIAGDAFQYGKLIVLDRPRAILPIPTSHPKEPGRFYDIDPASAQFIIDNMANETTGDWHSANYFTVNGRPYVSVLVPGYIPNMEAKFGKFVTEMRDYSQKKYGVDPYVVGVLRRQRDDRMLVEAGVDALTGYGMLLNYTADADPVQDYSTLIDSRLEDWADIQARNIVPFVPPAVVGWDSTPRGVGGVQLEDVIGQFPYTPLVTGETPELFEKMLRSSLDHTIRHVRPSERMGLICAWNEIGEGNSLLPRVRSDGSLDDSYIKTVSKVTEEYSK